MDEGSGIEASPRADGGTRVFVAGGSNVDAERNVLAAAHELKRAFPGARFSRAYRNAAVGFEGDDFINFVVELRTRLGLAALVGDLRRIEMLCGRPRDAPRWAPRSMDLDVLLFGDLVTQTPEATLPRPDLLKRPYMLGPLAELAPLLVHPTAREPIGELWQRFDHSTHAMVPLSLDLSAA